MKKWFAVVYCVDNTIHLWESTSKEMCEQKLLSMMKDKRFFDRVVCTTIINRSTDTSFIFGKPNSLDMKQRFIKLLRRRKVEFKNG